MPNGSGRYLGGNNRGYATESLPNIKGEENIVDDDSNSYGLRTLNPTGAFYGKQTTGNMFNSGSTSSKTYTRGGFFDASRSSSTYKDNAKVKPDTLYSNFIIKY